MTTVIKIALGLALGGLLIFFGRIFVVTYALKTISISANEMIDRQQTRIEQQRLNLINERRNKEKQMIMATKEREKNQQLAWKKEQAWYKWYKEPGGCDSWKSNAHMVECTNHKMRAKARFNQLWSQGAIDEKKI